VPAATVLLSGTMSLAGLYWAVTPAPLLELSATGALYHSFPLFPFVKQTLSWTDIANISAVKTGSRMELWVTVKPHAAVFSGSKPERRVRISQGLLPLSGDKLVQRLRRYHNVTYCKIQSGRVTELHLLSRNDDVTTGATSLTG
jgi:hypothetical protein